MELNRFSHASFRSVVGTGIGYVLLLVVMTVLFFGVPYLLFLLFL